MKSKKIIPGIALLFIPTILLGQTNPEAVTDESMDMFLLLFALGVIAIMIGAAVAGSIFVTILMLLLFLFISIGIISVSILAAFQRKSIAAGLKAFIYITSCLIGISFGSVGVWLVFKLLNLDVHNSVGIIVGVVAGLAGGILISYSVIKTFPKLIQQYKQRLSVK